MLEATCGFKINCSDKNANMQNDTVEIFYIRDNIVVSSRFFSYLITRKYRTRQMIYHQVKHILCFNNNDTLCVHSLSDSLVKFGMKMQ